MVDLTRYRSGKLTALEPTEVREDRHVVWRCRCECGNICYVNTGKLRSGYVQSCGCLKMKQGCGCTNKRTDEYNAWGAMKGRCLNSNNISYKHYGARNISICDRWLNSFENFLEDMGERPGPKFSIDRIDNNGNYEPKNCKWATQFEQAANTKKLRWFRALNKKTGEIYKNNNQREFARQHGITQAIISSLLFGRTKFHSIWKFEFIEEPLCN